MPGVLAHTAIRLAFSDEAIPSHVAALAAGATRAMFVTKIKIATAVAFALGLFAAGASVLTYQPLATPREEKVSQSDTKRQAEAKPVTTAQKDGIVEVHGRVVDPEGKPFAGAKLYLHHDRPIEKDSSPQATSGKDGQFSFTFERAVLGKSTRYGPWFEVIAVAEPYGPDIGYSKPLPRVEMTCASSRICPSRGASWIPGRGQAGQGSHAARREHRSLCQHRGISANGAR